MKHDPLPAVVSPARIAAFLTIPALGDVMNCASGNLATVDHTTLDIGSDFNFTVVPNGFELSGPPSQSIMAPIGSLEAGDGARLPFTVTDLNGGREPRFVGVGAIHLR